jgi:hypothetical protein
VSERKPRQAELRELRRIAGQRAGRRRRRPFVARADHPRCTGRGNKLRYSNREHAENVLREIALHGSGKQQASRAYQCDICGGWHVTSKARRDA